MTCPKCQADLKLNVEITEETRRLWDGFAKFPVSCERCDQTLWADVEFGNLDFFEASSDIIPELSDGVVVYIDNKEHDRHLQPANVVGRDHLYYRLEFWDGSIWMPEHWVKKLPEDMMS